MIFSCSTQLSLKFISILNDLLWLINPEILTNFSYFCIYEQFKFHAQLSWAWKCFKTLGPDIEKRNNLVFY